MSTSQPNSARNVDPFSLPEVMSRIVHSVYRSDILNCAIVSKDWYQVFILSLWKDFKFDRSFPLPPKFAVSKNSYLVTSLSFIGGMPRYISDIHFPQLQKILLSGSSRRLPEFSISFIASHPTIEDITIRYQRILNHVEFWTVLSNLPKLKTMNITGYRLNDQAVRPFWTTLCHLESAIFHDSVLSEAILVQPELPHKLRHITLTQMTGTQLELKLVERCTALKSLSWSSFRPDIEIVDCITRPCWLNLHKIQLSSVILDDLSLEKIFSSISILTDLKVSDAMWGPKSFYALSRHFKTLELFEDWHNTAFTSIMINTIMCSCSSLKELTAGVIQGLDIIKNNQLDTSGQINQEWICKDLKVLRVRFDLQGLVSQAPVLEKVARLTNLSELNMRGHSSGFISISFTLKDGLDILRPLKLLKFIRVAHDKHTMTEDDVRWIVCNWNRLVKIYGDLHHDPARSSVLHSLFDSYGIDSM